MSETQKYAALCRRIPLSVNSSTQRPVIPDDPETELRSGELPELVFGESAIFCFTFLNPDGSPVNFSGTEVFELSGDCDYDHETGLMLYAGAENLNLPGDWSEADPASGKIALRVSCNTENFAAKIAGQERLPLYLEVRMTASDGLTRSVLLRTEATALNTIHREDVVPEEIAAEYYTAAQTEARLNTKADIEHTHTGSEITDLSDTIEAEITPVEQRLVGQIDEKADLLHEHEQYVEANFVTETVSAAMPAGTVITFAGSTAPKGFLICNGALIDRTTYAGLFAAIGTIYGEGDGSTTFALPDLTDRFIQGSTTAGTVLDAGLPNILGKFRSYAYGTGEPGNAVTGTTLNTNQLTAGTSANTNYIMYNFDASLSNSIYGASNTVQPPALTMLYCIKY